MQRLRISDRSRASRRVRQRICRARPDGTSGQPGTVKVHSWPTSMASEAAGPPGGRLRQLLRPELPAADAAQLSGAEILETKTRFSRMGWAIDTAIGRSCRGSFAGRRRSTWSSSPARVQPEWPAA